MLLNDLDVRPEKAENEEAPQTEEEEAAEDQAQMEWKVMSNFAILKLFNI